MEAIKNFNELEEIIKNISRKYSRNTSIPYDDFVQDLWVKALEMTCDLRFMKKVLVNKAIDISRKNWNSQYRNIDTDFSDSIVTNEIIPDMMANHKTPDSDFIEIEIIEILSDLKKIDERAYIYAISKGYLNGNLIFLENQFNELFDKLSNEDKKLISNKSKYTDDIILKVFCKLKTGTNSGTARIIKRIVKDAFSK